MEKILSEKEVLILRYLIGVSDFTGPTNIGMKVFKKRYSVASSYTSYTCRKLVEKKLLIRNEKGEYKFNEKNIKKIPWV